MNFFFFFQAEDGIRDLIVTGVQTCALPILNLGYLQTLAELAGVRPAPDPASAQRLFRDSLPVAFLYHVRGVQGMNRRVSGVRMDVRGELPTIAGWRTEPRDGAASRLNSMRPPPSVSTS